MTYEELADKHAEEYVKHWIVGEDDNALMQEAYKDGFLDGIKVGRPQWHDLRKTPNDLPKATTPVLVILESGVPYVSWISSDKGWWFCTNYYTGEDKVIAWCELPTFDKEEGII